MIGNDIVDLQLSAKENNWRRKGFLNKIFSKDELEFIFSSEDQNLNVWRLWSMKEAAYKAHQRKFRLPRLFNPLKFRCEIESSEKGVVKNGIFGYNLFSEATSEYIYSEAFSVESNLKKSAKVIGGISSEELKNEFLRSYSERTGTERLEQLKILKDPDGVPAIHSGKAKIETRFSLTHHGRYSAFLFAASV